MVSEARLVVIVVFDDGDAKVGNVGVGSLAAEAVEGGEFVDGGVEAGRNMFSAKPLACTAVVASGSADLA